MSEHFIPFRRSDLLASLLDGEPEGERPGVGQLADILFATFHHEFHRDLEKLKDLYAPLDPNKDTRDLLDTAKVDVPAREGAVLQGLEAVLAKGNYRKVDPAELERALSEESVFQVKLHAQLDDFATLTLFARGEQVAEEVRREWFGLRKRPMNVAYYERVVLYARFKEASAFSEKRLKKLPFKPGATILKLFQNIPKADLEMLLPNTEVRMRLTDHAVILVPAVLGGLAALLKLGASLALLWAFVVFWIGLSDKPTSDLNKAALVALGLGALAFGMHVFRQVGRFRNRKIAFMKALSESLYFKNLDNNAGVFHRVIDDAEEEEGKEALLAYVFLRRAGKALTQVELDAVVEGWFKQRLACELDFEVDDGLAKLVRLGLVKQGDGRYTALPLAEAKAQLDKRWDSFFQY